MPETSTIVTIQLSDVIGRGFAQIKRIPVDQEDKKITIATRILVLELGKTLEQYPPL